MQRRNGLFWGIVLLTLGVLLLARRAGWLDVDWHSLVNLWPLLLILGGLNLILERRNNPAAFITTVMLAVAVPITLFGFFAHTRYHDRDSFHMRWRNHDNDEENDGRTNDIDDEENDDNESDYRSEREQRRESHSETYSNTFAETMDAGTREAVLKLAGGAGRFFISEPTSELIKADTKQTAGTYSMSVDRDATTHVPTIELKPAGDQEHIDLNDTEYENRVDVHLNATPVWTMDIALGAGQGDLDLSAYAVKTLKLSAGAAALDLKLGDRANQSDVKIDVGAATVTVRVPKEVGCRIKKDGALNLEQLDDFTSLSGGEFVSPGYDETTKKMTIRFDGGLSHLKVIRY